MIGGGIAGMFCARELARRGYQVDLLEATNRLGGRVETGQLGPGPDGPANERFKAEFGPMRFELDIQRRMKGLLDEYAIDYEPFSPPMPAEPPVQYPLEAAYRGAHGIPLSSLQLLKFGVLQLFPDAGPLEIGTRYDPESRKVVAEVQLSQPGEDWLNGLSDADGSFDRLRREAVMPGTGRPLRDYGFWNAMHQTLSPWAVATILHFGTFYHLMPDNPNAVEWAIFWLRLFQPGGRELSTVNAGVEVVIEHLERELTRLEIGFKLNHRVNGLRATAESSTISVYIDEEAPLVADHVILALPAAPLGELSAPFTPATLDAIDSVAGFPLLKVFCVTKTPPWWTGPREPQTGAWLAPTREVHYMPRDRRGDNTLVLFYTDRPADAFWRVYVLDADSHPAAEKNKSEELKRTLRRVLFEMHWNEAWAKVTRHPPVPSSYAVRASDGSQVLRALSAFHRSVIDLDPNDPLYAELAQARPAVLGPAAEVLFRAPEVWDWQYDAIGDFAIRDWGSSVVEAGCHAWKPKAQSWEVRKHLASFGLSGSARRNVHVCGEAYSDYQGFIEGALRSAVDACNAVLREHGEPADV